MRQKHNNILTGFFHNEEETKTLRIVQQYREEYKRVDEYLKKYPEILLAVHKDLQSLCKPDPKKDRTPDFTSEQLFRAVLVMQIEALDYRETTVRIAESNTLQNFCRLFDKETINHSLICYAFKTITPETWKKINKHFAVRMQQEEKITVDVIRTDTTVVETNIHYPTDSSLLWDTFRTIDRLWTQALDLGLGACLPDFRFHPEKVRKFHLDITRFVNSKGKDRKRKVKKSYKLLIERTAEALSKAKQIASILLASTHELAVAIGTELSSFIPAMTKVVDVARRRRAGEKVPIEDKVFSIFEPHTELIQRGKRDKPIEFGHKILLSETIEKFITDYEVFLKSPSDTKLLPKVLEQHHELFGEYPSGVAADMGFHPKNEDFEALKKQYKDKVEYFGVPSRLREFGDVLMSTFQRWRAGIEGTISCLKRACRLSRCSFKGFSRFCCGVGSAIFCHNLLTMVRRDMEPE
jgi:IS5 family transposase